MNSNESSTATDSVPDKDELYGRFEDVEKWNRDRLEWQGELYKKAAHKALDIGDPDDVGDINVNNEGINAEGLAALLKSMAPKPKASSPWKWITLATAIATGGFAAPAIIEALKPEPSTTVVQPGEDTNTQYELQFFED